MFTTTVSVRESDRFTQSAYIKFIRGYDESDTTGCSEMLLTVDQLENLADVLKSEASRIRQLQDVRHSETAI